MADNNSLLTGAARDAYISERFSNETVTLSDAARELELYADNTEIWIKPVLQNLSKHHKRGNFNLDLAIHSIERYCLTPAAKQYNLEHGSMTTAWHHTFPKAVRLEAAEVMARRYSAEFKLGNYW